MEITVHRGTHQIGGIATEIATAKTRILIDMGEDLSPTPTPLQIPGVTDCNGTCDAVLFTHHHGDHIGQMGRICAEIPLYAGELAKEIMLMSAEHCCKKDDALCSRIQTIRTFLPGVAFEIGNIRITPFSVDHSACDSYMFLLEAEGRRVLYMGDFRAHGFRGKALPKLLEKLVGKVDALVIEGTTLSRPKTPPMTERELQQKVAAYMEQYPYVFVLCSSTNLERICALSKSVPRGKYFVCDGYQSDLLDLLQRHWHGYSSLYCNLKKTVYGENLLPKLRERGFLMTVRDNRAFRKIAGNFDPAKSIVLYSMWEGYRLQPDSTIPDFLNLFGKWESLHTGGHAGCDDLRAVVEKVHPDVVIPVHTEVPEEFLPLCPNSKILLPKDKEPIAL